MAPSGPDSQEDANEQHILHLYDCYAAKLQSYAATIVRDEALAQDAVQEVFLRYALLTQKSRPISAPKAWLFRVMRNYLLDRTRSAHFRNEVKMEAVPDRADQRENPEQQYASAELSARILASLTPRERECLRLRFRGLRYAEIASVLDIQPGTVATLLFRCTERIQALLGTERERNEMPSSAKEPYAP